MTGSQSVMCVMRERNWRGNEGMSWVEGRTKEEDGPGEGPMMKLNTSQSRWQGCLVDVRIARYVRRESTGGKVQMAGFTETVEPIGFSGGKLLTRETKKECGVVPGAHLYVFETMAWAVVVCIGPDAAFDLCPEFVPGAAGYPAPDAGDELHHHDEG